MAERDAPFSSNLTGTGQTLGADQSLQARYQVWTFADLWSVLNPAPGDDAEAVTVPDRMSFTA